MEIARAGRQGKSMSAVLEPTPTAVPVADIGERLATVRLLPPRDLEMAASLRRFGQLSPVVVFQTGQGLEVIDGFRRRRAAAVAAVRFPTVRGELGRGIPGLLETCASSGGYAKGSSTT
jgi:hypothetical protein